jgi:hypothetical protein
MSLVFHLFLHVLSALIARYIVWRFWRSPIISFGAAFLGAVLIDLDHLIDYFLAFGFHFNLTAFIAGEQFAKSDKIYVLFHGWEYSILLAIVAWFLKGHVRVQGAICALALGMFFHLLIDVNINHGMTIPGYSLSYRYLKGYRMEQIVTPEHYTKHLQEKERKVK